MTAIGISKSKTGGRHLQVSNGDFWRANSIETCAMKNEKSASHDGF
jgi:hypothetical protein